MALRVNKKAAVWWNICTEYGLRGMLFVCSQVTSEETVTRRAAIKNQTPRRPHCICQLIFLPPSQQGFHLQHSGDWAKANTSPKPTPKREKRLHTPKGLSLRPCRKEASVCNKLFWKNPYFVHGRFPCKQMTGRSQTSSQIFSSTHQPSQPRSPAPPCWIWSGCTWMGTESSAPLFPAGAGSLWLGRYVHSLRWTRRGEPSQILYSRDFPRWCWLCSPQWLACTRSHPGKSKARTLTQQAELKLQCYAVPLTLQFFPLRKTKHLYTNREEEMGWII